MGQYWKSDDHPGVMLPSPGAHKVMPGGIIRRTVSKEEERAFKKALKKQLRKKPDESNTQSMGS